MFKKQMQVEILGPFNLVLAALQTLESPWTKQLFSVQVHSGPPPPPLQLMYHISYICLL